MRKIIARISNGLGNQMFLYASSYAISKELNRNLELDIISGIESDKKKSLKNKFIIKSHEVKYCLKYFKITSKITKKKNCFISLPKRILRKIYIFLDKFLLKKKFIIEHRNKDKITYFKKCFDNNKLQDKVYIEGYFETEKYFNKYKNEILNEFTFKKQIKCFKTYKNKILNTNSVSMSYRTSRYSEKVNHQSDHKKLEKSLKFELLQKKFINNSIKYFNKKIKRPTFFIFSDNPKKALDMFNYNRNNIIVISNFLKNKPMEDFYLMTLCKHHAVGPSSFHFWPAWLSKNKSKICVRPKNIRFSNNIDYWPNDWKAL